MQNAARGRLRGLLPRLARLSSKKRLSPSLSSLRFPSYGLILKQGPVPPGDTVGLFHMAQMERSNLKLPAGLQLVDQQQLKTFEELYQGFVRELSVMIPWAEFQHIGSTAVLGAITKGDVDIQIRIASEDFETTKSRLSEHFSVNKDSIQNGDFISFHGSALHPMLGLQVSVIGGSLDHFSAVRDIFRADGDLQKRYNELKIATYSLGGDVYRERKAVFLEGNILPMLLSHK